jgi:hypothetical protein
MALLAKILFDESPRPSDVRPDLPSALDTLVERMMAKDPTDRPASGAVLAAEIEGLEISARLPRRPVDRGPAVLTKSEQRLVFVVMVGCSEANASASCERDRTLEESTDAAPEVRAVARGYGGITVPLADGSTVVTIEAGGTANDQAAHAARCALALSTIAPGIPLALAMGRASEGGRLPLGDAVDLSWRLLRGTQAHGSRPILLDGTLVGLLDGRFVLGESNGITTLEAEKRRIAHPRTLLGKPTSCVGRERELAELAAMLDECIAERLARAVLVTAPAGFGKSRLLHELLADVRRLAQPPEIWLGYGDPMRAGSPFGMLAQAIRGAAEFHDGESIEIRRARIKARVGRHIPEADRARVTEFLAELAGVPFPGDDSVQLRAARGDATLMRDQLARAWIDWLAAETGAGPVLLVLEDIHWADVPSLRFVDAALRTVRDKPWMVLALGRPDVHDLFPRLWTDRRVREIRLEELSRHAAARLVRAALGEHVAVDVVERLVERSAGVPFYLEELIRAEAGGRGVTPETVLAMLQVRLERLPLETRRVLRAASVFGQAFHRGGVAQLCGATAPVRDAIAELEEQELVERRADGRFPGDEELVFRHALLREAAYGTLTEKDRVLGHRLAGQWLEDKGEPDAMVLAEHYERGDDSARAVRCFLRAAEQALDGSDFDAVFERAERGVACGAQDEALGALRLLQSEAQLWRGDLASAERHVILAMEHLPNGSTRWYRAALGLLMQSANRGHEGETARVIRELAASEQRERSAAQTMAFALALRLLAMEGRLDGARTFVERLQAIDRELSGEPAITAMVSGGLFYWWSFVEWDPWTRKQCAERCARESEMVGDVMNASMAKVHVGWACIALGEFEHAERVLRNNLAVATARGLGGLIVDFTRIHLGAALGALGRLDEGIAIETDAIATLCEAGNWLYGAVARVELARLFLRKGNVDDAERESRIACTELGRVPPVRIGALALHSQALLAADRPTQALDVARMGAASVARAGSTLESEPLLRLALADALQTSRCPPGAFSSACPSTPPSFSAREPWYLRSRPRRR